MPPLSPKPMKSPNCRSVFGRGVLPLAACLSFTSLQQPATAAESAQTSNPIARLARVFNPRLSDVEDRVQWLNTRLSTLASHREQPLKTGLGFRGARIQAGDPSPTVVVDLGSVMPIDNLYLIPVQRDYAEDDGLFPRNFTIEFSESEDFSNPIVLYTTGTGAGYFPNTHGKPVRFIGHGHPARFIRIVVESGHSRGASEVFALSEIIAVSNQQPVSFGAKVSASGSLDIEGIWSASYLTDGSTPLGIWQSGTSSPNRGDLVEIRGEDVKVSWSVQLGDSHPIDRIIVFPYELTELVGCGIVPEQLQVEIEHEGVRETIGTWKNPLAGSSVTTPIVIQTHRRSASKVILTGLQPLRTAGRQLQGLSEIQIWDGNQNLAAGRTVNRVSSTGSDSVLSLSDGFASSHQICTVEFWLNQLHERWSLERELESLHPVRQQMASDSELNATWGSAVMLGLTFLIPVVIVERRRLISRNQLDQLRKRIASDLHDDIGSNLGSISLIARTAKKDLIRQHGPEDIAEDLGEVELIARESSLAMRDIVWLLERNQDSIGDLVQRMRETAGRLLREIDYTIECESNKTAARLSLDAKRHLFLFYKEAVHNIVKHSRAKQAVIRLWDDGDQLALEIRDNGVGLKDATLKPSAVKKLEERARVLEGKLQIDSSTILGTVLRLTVKRSNLIATPTTP